MKDYRLALVVDKQDFESIEHWVNVLSAAHPYTAVVNKETPDNIYTCIYWDSVQWDRPAAEPLKEELAKIRHALVAIDEEGSVYKEFEPEDRNGIDEEFYELLSIHTKISFWDETDLERVVDYEKGTSSAEKLRELYPEGTVIEMVHGEDFHAAKQGVFGKVSNVDDAGTVHVNWETGSTLGLVPGVDKFRSHGLPKFLCVSASTENNEAITSVYESKDLESLIEATLDYEVYDEERDAIMKHVDKAGCAVYPDEDDPIVEVYIRRGGSPFGTDQAEVRVWRSDVLERYNQTYIELPLQGVKALAPAKTSCAGASTPKPCVVISHSFDTETIVYEYDSDTEAEEALERHYNEYMDEEKRNGSSLDDSGCFCEETYARITWADGCITEFTLSFISKEV